MKIHITSTPLLDLLIIDIHPSIDERGFFFEPWNKRDFKEAGINCDFVQEGHSRSKQGVLRGLHYQNTDAPMAKLSRCTVGNIFDVSVDLRMESQTFGKWFGIMLDADDTKSLFVPSGFAHGFLTLSPYAEVQYKQTGYYVPRDEGTLSWNDPDVAILWPIKPPFILSPRDTYGKTLKEYKKFPAFSNYAQQ
jgi:dTDP-4-dehydrorhamnose 3,5-epimerase